MTSIRIGTAAGTAWLALAGGLAASAPAVAAPSEIAMFSQRKFQGARYSLEAESNSMSFSPRSVRVTEGSAWQLCPRPFYGGDCLTIRENNESLNLPRSFSGMVRSARPVKSAAEPEKPAPKGEEAAKPALEEKPKNP